ncbi:MAG: ABC transporter permease [Actinobacteria bacterium]|nr:ABC transporter permease [Actinomycetota bacterium]
MSSTAPTGSFEGRSYLELTGESTSPARLARSVWASRGLLAILARKEFQVRYRRASFGLLWAVGLPLVQALVMALVFSKVAHIHGAPHYVVFVLSGLVGWTFFSTAISSGSTAVVDNSELSSRIYFPRALLALVSVASNLYGFVVTLVIVIVLCPILNVGLGASIWLVIPASLLMVGLATTFSLVASALQVYFRDIRYIVSAAVIVWFYVTPIIYPSSAVPGKLRLAVQLNPVTEVVALFHAATVGGSITGLPLVSSLVWLAVLAVLAVYLQCRYDRVFADLL